MAAYTKRIEIQRFASDFDALGNEVQEWRTVLRAWASAVTTTGKEYYEAAQVNAENDVAFRLRYSRTVHGLTPAETRVLYAGKVYDVKRITDYRELHQTLEIKAVEINGGD